MKINLKSMLLVLGLLLVCGFTTTNVHAATLTKDNTDYYYDRKDQNGNNHHSWYWKYYTIDGKVAYCIEPGTPEGTTYPQTSYEATGLPTSIKERIMLIAYYGYTYPGHATVKYRAATQGMLWETILGNGTNVKFTTQRYAAGSVLDYSNERAEIERLIAHHYTKPSFNGGTFTAQVGETITLTDTNGVLGNYSVSVTGANYSVDGNNLVITPTTNGDITIRMVKNMPYEEDYKIFSGDGIQNMLVPGRVDPVVATVKVNSYLGSVDMNKADSVTKVAQGQATLAGAVYGVYRTDGTEITRITTDENGYGKSDNVLPYGTYYLKEISPSKGYYLDETKYDFDSKGHANVTMNVVENVIENKISILKQYDYVDGNTTFLRAEKGIKFEISYPDGTVLKTVTTDEKGYAEFDLVYGTWTLHQVNTDYGFEKIKDFTITVDENSPKEHYYNILNNKLSAYLQVLKVDSETGKTIAIANTTFKILNVDTNKYVSQYVAGKTYDTFKTDEEGKFQTYLKLESGHYKLVEISSPRNYLLNTDGLEFTVDNDSEFEYTEHGAIVTVEFANQVIKGQIKIDKKGEVPVVKDGTIIYETKSLKGVKFNIYANEDIKSADGKSIYHKKGDLVDTIITDENGYAISKELYLGKYYLVETETNDNYVLNKDKYEFELVEKDNKTPIVYKSYSALNYYKKGELEFSKEDLTTGKGIPNTKVEVYHIINEENNERELVFTGVTDKEGKLKVTDLFVGKFVIIETEAATGYRLSDEEVSFEIKENGEIVKASMTNEKITSTVGIHKVDEEGKALEGVTIGVYDLDGNLIYSGITNENGDIEFVLEYGSYYFQEIETIDGYELSDEKVYFDVTEDGEYIQKTLVNELKEIEVPNTLSNSYVNLAGLIIIALGAGFIIISSMNNKKKK